MLRIASILLLILNTAWAGGLENALRLRKAIELTSSSAKPRAVEVIKLPVSRGFHQKDSQLCWVHSFLNALETMDLQKNPHRKIELSRAAFQRRTMEDRLERKLARTHHFMLERGTPIDALALARKHGILAFEDYTDIVLKAEAQYPKIYRVVGKQGADSLQSVIDKVFAAIPEFTHLEGRILLPSQLAEELLAGQNWVAYAPGAQEGWGPHPDPDARPEARAYIMSLEKITNLIRESLREGRPVTYGGNGHSILIYGAHYDESGRPLKYLIKDSYPNFFYEASPGKMNREMLEVTLPVKTPPSRR